MVGGGEMPFNMSWQVTTTLEYRVTEGPDGKKYAAANSSPR